MTSACDGGDQRPAPRVDAPARRAPLTGEPGDGPGRTRAMPIRLDSRAADFAARFPRFSPPSARPSEDVEQAVRAIIADVRARGDRALIELTRKFDRVDLDTRRRCASRRRDRRGGGRLRPRGARRADARARPHRGLSPPPEADGRPLHRRARRRARPPLDRDRGGRPLRAGRHRRLSVVGADERGAGQGRRRAAPRHGGAGAGRQAQPAGAGGGEARRRRRDLSRRRRAGGGGARLRHRRPSRRSPRSSAPATPMWRRPSAWSSARSAST